MKISNNALNVLTAKTYKGIGNAWVVTRLRYDETTDNIVTLLNKDSKEDRKITHEEFECVKENIKKSINGMNGFMDGVVAIGDIEFPAYRGDVKNSERPVVLFYRGNLSLLDKENRNVAVIGLLNPDEDTEIIENEVVSKLVGHGATIVSGLAVGCDTIAHKQALCSGGKTVAILPGSLNEILPVVNKGLAEEIVRKNGLLVTEYYEKAKSRMELRGRYAARDRLQALFSDCVVLTASYAENNLGNDSGSRLAMESAKKYSIPRSIIYDESKDGCNQKYDLNRQLMKEQSNIIVINRNNMDSAVHKIIYDQSAITPLQECQDSIAGKIVRNQQFVQADLFG